MRYTEVSEGLIVHCTKEMKESLKGQVNHCVFMNLTLEQEPGPFCTVLHYIEGLGW